MFTLLFSVLPVSDRDRDWVAILMRVFLRCVSFQTDHRLPLPLAWN